MKLNELINRKKPLFIDGERVEDVMVKPLPVSKFMQLQKVNSVSEEEKFTIMKDLILFSIVDENNLSVINEDDLTMDLIETLIDAILNANGLGEDSGKSITQEEESPNI